MDGLRADPGLSLFAVGFRGAHLPASADLFGIYPRRHPFPRLLAGRLDGGGPALALPAGGQPRLRPRAQSRSGTRALVSAMALRAVARWRALSLPGLFLPALRC